MLTGLRLERAQSSKQFERGRFRNTKPLPPVGPTPGVITEYFFGAKKRTPRVALPVESPLEKWSRSIQSGLRITWLGHSTMLLEVDGTRVLTDPVFGDRASPVSFAGAKRFHPVPAKISELPKLDAILLSHDHYDHLCAESMRALAKLDVPVITSLGVGARLEKLGVRTIHELDWWEQTNIGPLSFTATPAQHFSGRSLTDRNATLWSSWVIETDRHRLFFSGDTGLTDEFAVIRDRFGAFDVIMLEIGAWNEAWGDIHLGPANALKAFDMLGGGTLLPVHWGTFDLALHAWDEPAETLLDLAGSRRILTPSLGRPFEPAEVDRPNPWWRALRDLPKLVPAKAK